MEKDKFSCDSGRPIKDKLVMFRKMLMHAWCDNEKPKCAVFVSQRAVAEACAGEPKEVAKWLKQVRAIPRVDGLNANVLDLTQKLLDVFGSLRLFCRVLCIACCALPLWDARGAISYYDVDITQDYAVGDLTVYSTRQATKLVGQQGYRSSYEGSGVRLNVKVPNGKVAKVTIVGTSHSVRQGGVSQIVFHIEDERYREGSVYEKSYAANTTIPLYLTFSISGLSGEVVGHYRVDVRYETVAKPKADLTVACFLASPTSAGVTDAINVQYTIKNCGERSSDSCKAYVYDGSAKIGESTISAISAGCSFDGNFRITAGSLSVGTHTLKVKVDGANQVEEKSESNNESAVQSVTVSAVAPIIQGDTVEVRFHLNGMDALVDKVITKIYRIGQPYSDCHFPSPGGKSGYVFINWVDSSGEFVFETDIALASLRDIYAAWEPLTPVEDEPDLQPYTPSGWSGPLVVSTSSTSTTDSSRFSSGDTIYVSWAAICRDGSAGAFKTELDVDGVRKQTWSCSGLNEGYYTYKDSYSIGKLSVGLHVIKVIIDSEEGVSESNESNNTYSKTITVEDEQHETDISLSVSESGGTKSAKLATKSGVSYKFDCTGRPDWVTGLKIVDGSNSMTIGSGTTTYGGMNDGLSLSFTVAANTTSSSRSWTLYVYKGSEVFHRVTVRQDAGSTPTTYAVKFTPGAYGSGSRSPSTKTHGVSLTLPGAAFTRTGYTQTGWSTDYYGSTKDYSLSGSYTSNSDTTLYPYWTANTYYISYSLNGGSHGSTHPASATYDSAFYVSAPSRSGYTFAGWTVTSGLNTSTAKWGTSSSPSTSISSSSTKCANGTGSVYFNNLTATSGGSVTLTANWTANPDPRLADFEINDGVLTAYHGPGGPVRIPDGVSVIGEFAFEYSDVTEVTMGEGVEHVEAGAFSYCLKLKQVVLADTVKTIGIGAFYCTHLQTLVAGPNVREIGENAFRYCYWLATFYAPSSVHGKLRDAFSQSESSAGSEVAFYSAADCAKPRILFESTESDGAMAEIVCERGRVCKLPPSRFRVPSGKRFAGWACSNGRRYDDGMLVFDLAEPGETVTMTAIWE